MAGPSSADDSSVNVDVANHMSSKYPIMRRLDQQWALEAKFSDYEKEISRVSSKNKVALSHLGYQERRLKEMQALLRSPPSTQADNDSGLRANSHPNYHYRAHGAQRIDDCRHRTDARRRMSKQAEGQSRYSHAPNTALTTPAATRISRPQIPTRKGSVVNAPKPSGVPNAPANFLVAEVGHNSFTVVWDVDRTFSAIVDYEIKYSFFTEGREEQVWQRCSRWCLKDPVPCGRFVVENLRPSTRYLGIAIRCRNLHGWSQFSDSIKCICTAPKDEEYENRRSKFIYRIGHIERSIEELQAERRQIPALQVMLARKMAKTQDERMMELNEELERVVSHRDDELLPSHLLQGVMQMFTKATLKRKLEQELVLCKEDIAQWRAEIIDLDKESGEMAAEIRAKETRLNERKGALLRFDRQHAIVLNMKLRVSKGPNELLRFCIARWRSRVAARLEARKVIDSLAISSRRRIYARAWRKLCSLVSSRREAIAARAKKDPDGIGGLLLNVSENCMEENLHEISDLAVFIRGIQEKEGDELTGKKLCDLIECGKAKMAALEQDISLREKFTHLLCREDRGSLETGEFLFKAGHYESSLKSYRAVLSKMELPAYFGGMSSGDAIALYAEVNGKVGHLHVKLGSFDLAIVYFGRQLSLAEEEDLDQSPHNNNEQRIDALLGLGMCYHEKFDHVYAEGLFKRALQLCLSGGDRARELIAYSRLQSCCECLNRPSEAAAYAAKIKSMDTTSWNRESGGTAVSRKVVDASIADLDRMRCRLIDVTAQKSRAVKLEIASAHRVQLERAKADKEKELDEASELLAESSQRSVDLQELLEQIRDEMYEAKNTKKNRVISRLVQGTKQDVKRAELIIRLEEELKVVQAKLEECLTTISETKMRIHNTKDDIKVLNEELVVENGPLLQQILRNRMYRCVSLNASNVACDDVTGRSDGGVPYVASTEGESCYIHSIDTGNLACVFIGDEEGSTATIASVFFHGNRVYTGTMDSLLIGWDLSMSKRLFVSRGHESAVTCIYADDTKLVSGSSDKSIMVWNTDGTLIRRVQGHARGVQCIQCGPSRCVSASYSTVFVWDIRTEKETGRIKGFHCQRRMVLPSDGNVTSLQYGELEVITGDSLGAISVWWIGSGELLQNFKVHDGPVASLQVDATKVVSCGLDAVVSVSDVIRGDVLHSLRGHSAPVLAVAFDRDRIVSVSSDGEMRYWSWESPSSERKTSHRYSREAHADESTSVVEGKADARPRRIRHRTGDKVAGDGVMSRGSLMNRLASKVPIRRGA